MKQPKTIRELRELENVTQFDLATRSGLGYSVIRELERKPLEELRIKYVRALVRALGYELHVEIEE